MRALDPSLDLINPKVHNFVVKNNSETRSIRNDCLYYFVPAPLVRDSRLSDMMPCLQLCIEQQAG